MLPITTPTFRRLTEPGDKNLWPMWAADGQTVYYVSDHGGPQNLWARPADAVNRGEALWIPPGGEHRETFTIARGNPA